MASNEDITKLDFKSSNTRALTLNHMTAKLKFVNPNILNILKETEFKCFNIANSQENYRDLIESAITLYKAQEAFYGKIAESLNNIKKNIKKENQENSQEKIKELFSRFKSAEKAIDKSNVLKEIKSVSQPVYNAIILKLKKLKSDYEANQQDTRAKKQKLNEIEEIQNKKIKLEDEQSKSLDDVPKCTICLDSFNEIKSKKRNAMSTNCGHLICSECNERLFSNASNKSVKCFSCRKNLKKKDMHNIYF